MRKNWWENQGFGLSCVHLKRGKYLATFWWPVGEEPICSKDGISLFKNILLKFVETESKTVVSRTWREEPWGAGLMTREFQFGKTDVLQREGGEGGRTVRTDFVSQNLNGQKGQFYIMDI